MQLGGWEGWLVPIAAFLLIGFLSMAYLRQIRLPQEEVTTGVASLAALRWREFIQLVLDALLRRGYERVFDTRVETEDGDYLLERDGQRYLLSSKRGATYVLGSTAIAEFASSIRMRGVAGGFLVTPGRFAPEAVPLARAQRIELLDGPTLWPELKPLLSAEQLAALKAPSQARLGRFVVLAWAGALLVGIVLFVIGRQMFPDQVKPANTATAAIAARPAVGISLPERPAVASKADDSAEPSDPAQLERRRSKVAGAISTLPGIDRAIWLTQSTLLVYLQDAQFDPLHEICPELVRYDELAATRLQLQPPADSGRPVRFVQCRPY
jgi:restriction system protein